MPSFLSTHIYIHFFFFAFVTYPLLAFCSCIRVCTFHSLSVYICIWRNLYVLLSYLLISAAFLDRIYFHLFFTSQINYHRRFTNFFALPFIITFSLQPARFFFFFSMAYNQSKLDQYRQQLLCVPTDGHASTSVAAKEKQPPVLLPHLDTSASASLPTTTIYTSCDSSFLASSIGTFVCPTCPYCTGARDATVKHVHPSTKPGDPMKFWNHVVLNKYRHLQSKTGRENMDFSFVSSLYGKESEMKEEKTDQRRNKMFVVGPMVDQSELPFRLLCREEGATLTYTPMLHSKSFVTSDTYRRQFLTTTPLEEILYHRKDVCSRPLHEDGRDDAEQRDREEEGENTRKYGVSAQQASAEEEVRVDRPVFVQFCGSEPDTVLEAARLAVRGAHCCNKLKRTSNSSSEHAARHASPPVLCSNGDEERDDAEKGFIEANGERYYHCDAVDLNLGCPQGIARRGHYGSFLMEEWDTIHTILHTLHCELEVPVTAKIRVFDQPDGSGGRRMDLGLTLAYIKMILDAGASVICIHGRTRAMKGQDSGLADMEFVKRLCDGVLQMTPKYGVISSDQSNSSSWSTSTRGTWSKNTDNNNNSNKDKNTSNNELPLRSSSRSDTNTSVPLTSPLSTPLYASIPLITNGNVLRFKDIADHLSSTGAAGHMCAEPLLWNPSLFRRGKELPSGRLNAVVEVQQRLAGLQHAKRYLWYVRRWPVPLGMVKAHLFKMLYWTYEAHPKMRVSLSLLEASAVPELTCVSDSYTRSSALSFGISPDLNTTQEEPNGFPAIPFHRDKRAISHPDTIPSPTAYDVALRALEQHVRELTQLEEDYSLSDNENHAASASAKEDETKWSNSTDDGRKARSASLTLEGPYSWFTEPGEEEDLIHLFDTVQ